MHLPKEHTLTEESKGPQNSSTGRGRVLLPFLLPRGNECARVCPTDGGIVYGLTRPSFPPAFFLLAAFVVDRGIVLLNAPSTRVHLVQARVCVANFDDLFFLQSMLFRMLKTITVLPLSFQCGYLFWQASCSRKSVATKAEYWNVTTCSDRQNLVPTATDVTKWERGLQYP